MKELAENTLKQILQGNSENLNLEFKDSFDFENNLWAREKLIRAILAMSNTRNGGYIVIGVKEKTDKILDFSGLEESHLFLFKSKLEDLKAKVESFSSSPVSYEVGVGKYKGKDFILIAVVEFYLNPLICRKNGEHKDKLLEEGAIYIRTLKDKPSSIKLTNPVDIQDFLERALNKHISNLHKGGWKHDTEKTRDSKSFFENEKADFYIEDIKKKIDEIGNIKVTFEPSFYNNNLIQKKELQNVLEKSQINLRGRNFPHIPIIDENDTKKPYSIGNGIEFYTNWEEIIEAFRFYQSGLFIGEFALREDMINKVYGKKIEPGKYLDFLIIIYRMTEVVLFIKNLIENSNIERGELIIEINKTQGRELESIFNQRILSFNAGYICHLNQVIAKESFSKEEIAVDFLEISQRIIKKIFDEFNWNDYSDSMINTHQENLLNRRI